MNSFSEELTRWTEQFSIINSHVELKGYRPVGVRYVMEKISLFMYQFIAMYMLSLYISSIMVHKVTHCI